MYLMKFWIFGKNADMSKTKVEDHLLFMKIF